MAKLMQTLADNPQIQQGVQWYRSQTARDQLIVKLVGTLFVLALIFLLIIWPLVQEHKRLNSKLDSSVSFYNLMASNAGQFAGQRGGAVVSGKPLLTTVSQFARRQNVTLTRYEQDGDALRVWIDDGNFDDVATLIETLSRTQGIRVSQINVDRVNEPGKANVRATFTQS